MKVTFTFHHQYGDGSGEWGMRIPINKVPIDVRRKAAQHLEDVRDTRMGTGASKAKLDAHVYPMFRPDLDEVAYYEFEVDLQWSGPQRLITTPGLASGSLDTTSPKAKKPKREESSFPGDHFYPGDHFRPGGVSAPGRTSGEAPTSGRGFIIVSASDHDFPIPHWSFESEPVSRRLEATAKEAGKKVSRIYKLDALAYVAEDKSGEMAAHVGQLPIPIDGLPEDLEEARGKIHSSLSRPKKVPKDDGRADKTKHVTTHRGPRPPRLSFREISSWAELKDLYSSSFAPFLKDLRRRAAAPWEIDQLVSKFGEGIMVGEPHRVALLETEAVIDLTCEAADLVEVELIERRGVPPIVELLVGKKRLNREASFQLDIVYASGLKESLLFFAVSPDTPSNQRDRSSLDVFEEAD
jgi:hypothetical protein